MRRVRLCDPGDAAAQVRMDGDKPRQMARELPLGSADFVVVD